MTKEKLKKNIPSPVEIWEMHTHHLELQVKKLESQLESTKKNLIASEEMLNKYKEIERDEKLSLSKIIEENVI